MWSVALSQPDVSTQKSNDPCRTCRIRSFPRSSASVAIANGGLVWASNSKSGEVGEGKVKGSITFEGGRASRRG